VKGHYRKARAGEIADFTGVSAPYDVPEAPDVVVDTETQPLDECVRAIVDDLVRATSLRAARDAITSAAL
jgi:adenylylsulfate kinase-like enzyme